jgi:hypothetical protein
VAAAPLLASCSLDAGDAAGSEFDDWLADHPVEGVTAEVTSTQNALPGAGSAAVTAKVTGEHVPAAIADAAGLCDFEPPSGSSIELTLSARRFSGPFPCTDPDRTVEAFTALFRAVDGHRDVRGAEASSYGIEVRMTSPAALHRSLRDLVAAFRESSDLYAHADGSELSFTTAAQRVSLDLGLALGGQDALWPTPEVLAAVDATLRAAGDRALSVDVAEGLVHVTVPGTDAQAAALQERIVRIDPAAADLVRVVASS